VAARTYSATLVGVNALEVEIAVMAAKNRRTDNDEK
jgi:hypothetical protein